MKMIKRRVTVSSPYQDNPALGFLIENLEGCLASPEARVFKRDHTSIVAACPVEKTHFVVKQHYPHHRLKELVRSFRKSKARRSWEGAHFLKSRGIKAVEPAALVEDRIFFLNFRSFFIGDFLQGINARFYLLDPEIPPESKRAAVQNIIRSLKKMHDSDATHGDTKDVNIFIRDRQACWLDLDNFKSNPLFHFAARKRKEKDWMLLLYNWRHHPGLHEMFVREMENHYPRDHIAEIIKRLMRRRKKKQAAEKARIHHPSCGAVMRQVKKTRIRLMDSGGREAADIYTPGDSDPIFWQNIARKCRQNVFPGLESIPSSTTARVQAGYIANLPYKIFLKIFYHRNRKDYFKQNFRRSRAYRDFRGARTAASRGLQVPEVCCVIEIKKYGMRRRSITITREVEHGLPLGRLLEELQQSRDFGTRRHVIQALGREMARWHTAGMQHGDARDTNILCRLPCGMQHPDAQIPRSMEFIWLDNERSRPAFRKYEFMRNLVQLNMTRSGITITDRMRFWKAYWADAGHLYSPRSAETVLAKIAARTRQRWKVRGWL